ncbi:MAG: kelch repeat-containing protein [Candidatus Poribacteria bacterium]
MKRLSLFRMFMAFVMMLAGLSCISALAWGQDTGFWTTLSPMPTAREGVAAAVVGGEVYAIGGYEYDNLGTFRTILATVEKYKPTADNWQSIKPMPSARAYLAAATVNDKIYAIGGWYAEWDGSEWVNKQVLSTVEVYDPVTKSWNVAADMQTPRSGFAVAVANNKIYAIGGWNPGNRVLSTIEVYDPATDTWSAVAPMPTARAYLTAAAVNNRIYAIGGYVINPATGLEESSSIVEMYDPVSNTWSTVVSMPTARDRLAAAAVNDRIYAIGGWNIGSQQSLDINEEYNPFTGSWRVVAPMPSYRIYLAAAVVNDKVIAIGGRKTSDLPSNKVEEYTPLAPPILPVTIAGRIIIPGRGKKNPDLPVANATLQLWLDGEMKYSTKTDGNGEYYFEKVRPNEPHQKYQRKVIDEHDTELEIVAKDKEVHYDPGVNVLDEEIRIRVTKPGKAAPALINTVPEKSELGRNYPNPFNPETWIPYMLAEDAVVLIDIYDMKGQRIRRLDLGYRQAGYYLNRSSAAYWDGRNERGERVASGMYFYTLQAGSFTASRKMLLMK